MTDMATAAEPVPFPTPELRNLPDRLFAPPAGSIGIAALDELATEFAEADGLWRSLRAELEAMRATRRGVEADDESARVAAHRAGRKDPGRKGEQELNGALADLEDRRAVVRSAMNAVVRDFAEARREHAAELEALADERRDAATEAWTRAVDVLEDTWTQLGEAQGLWRWARSPDPRARHNDRPPIALGTPVAVVIGELRALAGGSGG